MAYKYTFGERLIPTDAWRRRAHRVVRAVQRCGFICPKINWKWTDSIRCIDGQGESFPLSGLMYANAKSVTIWIDLSRENTREDTMIHEVTHAVLEPIEPEDVTEEHHPVFDAMQGMISRAYDFLKNEDKERMRLGRSKG